MRSFALDLWAQNYEITSATRREALATEAQRHRGGKLRSQDTLLAPEMLAGLDARTIHEFAVADAIAALDLDLLHVQHG